MTRLALVLLLVASTTAAAARNVTIRIDPDRVGPRIGATHYGIFLEEINTAIDGGLYAELVRNRGFEEAAPPEGFHLKNGRWVNDGGYATSFAFQADKDVPYWHLVSDNGARAVLSLDTRGDLNGATPRAAKLVVSDIGTGRAGLANEGFWGIAAAAGQSYTLSVWLKSAENYAGTVSVTLESAGGETLSAPVRVDGPIDGRWRRVTATLHATRTDPKARLVIAASAPGTLWFDMVSLFPAETFKSRPNGVRADIAQMIADLRPGFVRFPGGCVVEGATHQTAYDWKGTIGPIEERREAWNVWDYRRTHGMGFLEYLQFIEDIAAAPMFVSSAGQTCIFRHNTTPVPMEQMQPLAQNFIDAMEYANGDESTKWGKRRIEDGHPSSFNMKMMEIGNENVGEEYLDRYAFIYPLVKAKYPDSLLLACIPSGRTPTEMVDEHYYSSPNWFVNNASMYDRRDRSAPPVYIAEVAVTTDDAGKDRGNLQAALAEGVFLMGTERNADVVKMVSYAPLLANVDGRTPLAGAPPAWHGMIYFDSSRVFGTASYYLWKTFAENKPSLSVETTVLSQDDGAAVTGKIGLGTWGTSAEFKDVRVEKNAKLLYASDFPKSTEGWTNSGGRWRAEDGAFQQGRVGIATNTFGDAAWSDYTLTLKARKLAGNEGFLILFGSGEDRLWWNLGGWGNHEHGIEFNQMPVGERVEGTIETNRWYDIKIELRGRDVKCYLDGQLVNQGTVPVKRSLHALAGVDEFSGDLIVKVINTSNASVMAILDLPHQERYTTGLLVTTLTSAQSSDNNSLGAPLKVVPSSMGAQPLSVNSMFQFPATSLTVIRIPK
jgi:alpha-L-arabinofuranosidase